MAQQKSARSARRYKPKRTISKKQRAIYRRRRIVVGLVLLAMLALVVFCAYSLGRGVVAIGETINHNEIYAVSRRTVPDPPSKSAVPDCSADDVALSLSAAAQSIPVGGSVEFTATITYTGKSKVGCLIDASDAGRVLTITSGSKTIWRSDSCPVDSRRLLLAKGDADEQKITWNADSTGSECVGDGTLPKVNAGTYAAQLSLKDQPKAKSDSVTVNVQ